MAEYYNCGDCIDGKRVLIRFKKINLQPKGYVSSPTGFKGTKYKCSRDGHIEIRITLQPNNANLAKEKKPSVHLHIGDSLKSEQAFFIAESIKKLNCFKVTMMSGRHECNEGQPDVRVYAEITTPFKNIVHAAEKKLMELERKQQISEAKPFLLT